ncbi:hypothetical protein CHS0354_023501 [Potamilus streckersoni]|uniref:Tudor domain-containing protein n=1 Tax=Potamilus streckersoni TaxID=2493646 RepID=A0AAE0RVF1_9BIVA|nr:hypothetical protein CHS0354_023501 [Potamilus streckersoni]
MASSKIIVEVECIKNEEEVEVINTSDPEPLTLPSNLVWDVHIMNIYGSKDREVIRFIRAEYSIICFFMDYADMETVDSEQLKPIDPAINRKLPYQATKVSLHGLGHVAQKPIALDVLRSMALGRSRVAVPIMRYE